jgi:hypothetical protein
VVDTSQPARYCTWKKDILIIHRKPKAVYVNAQQAQRQREHIDKAKKVVVPARDPAIQLAKAWGIRRFTSG